MIGLAERLNKIISILFYALVITIPLKGNAKEQIAKLIEFDNATDYNGNYHCINSEKLNPVENLMKEANFCEIDGEYLLIPYQNPELITKGYLPLRELATEKVFFVMNGDVFEYFDNLKETYNTPLKIKRFRESEEYNDLYGRLQIDKSQLLENTFYSIRTLSENEIFDLDKKCFRIQLPSSFSNYSSIYLYTRDNHFERSGGVLEYITPEMDEDTAYKIESNPCEIIVFVKFTGETIVNGRQQSICKPTKVCIANENNGDIYFEYTTDNDLSNPIPKQDNELSPLSPELNLIDTKVYTAVETPAEFPGGSAALMKFLSENIRYPADAAANNIMGRVAVRFVVSIDGSIGDINVIKGVSPEIDKEAIRVIRKMPKWKPGTVNGHPVNSFYTMPVTFKLQNS